MVRTRGDTAKVRPTVIRIRFLVQRLLDIALLSVGDYFVFTCDYGSRAMLLLNSWWSIDFEINF